MSKPQGNTRNNPHFAREIKATVTASKRRIKKNHDEADELERQGYHVERDLHKNGAYFAEIGREHHEHERNIGRIFAENGLSFTLDREGAMVQMPDGRKLRLPVTDGTIENTLTHEIYRLGGKPNPMTVVEGIKHSYKVFNADRSKSVQADVAITSAPPNSKFTRREIDDGVTEVKRQIANGEMKAHPRFYLHVNENDRKIYYRRLY